MQILARLICGIIVDFFMACARTQTTRSHISRLQNGAKLSQERKKHADERRTRAYALIAYELECARASARARAHVPLLPPSIMP